MNIIFIICAPLVIFFLDLMAKNKFSYRKVSEYDVLLSKKKGPLVYFIVRRNLTIRVIGLVLVGFGLIISAVNMGERSVFSYEAILLLASGGAIYGVGVSWTYFFLK